MVPAYDGTSRRKASQDTCNQKLIVATSLFRLGEAWMATLAGLGKQYRVQLRPIVRAPECDHKSSGPNAGFP